MADSRTKEKNKEESVEKAQKLSYQPNMIEQFILILCFLGPK